MDFEARLELARDAMRAQGIELLVGFHNGVHFIEKPDPVLLLSRFKALAESAVFLPRDGEVTVVVTPAWDAPRAARYAPGASVIGTHDLAGAAAEVISCYRVPAKGIGLAGLSGMRWEIEARVRGLLGNDARNADDAVFRVAQRKTAEEIARAETAARIAAGHCRGPARRADQVVHEDTRRRGRLSYLDGRTPQSHRASLARSAS